MSINKRGALGVIFSFCLAFAPAVAILTHSFLAADAAYHTIEYLTDTEAPEELIEPAIEHDEQRIQGGGLGDLTSSPPLPTPQPQPALCAERIVIASLGVDNCIVNHTASELHITPTSASGRVANISTNGARFIYGHNSQNIFASLGNIRDGALIQVITSSGTETFRASIARSHLDFRYRCLRAGNVNNLPGIATYRAANCPHLITMTSLIHAPASTLTLMTCAGSYDPSLGTYDRRHIIFATRID
ncbi:sortase [Candidatus Saccharibacteria bacterium]|nr:sortase [Candidatus Saccharibacteria bacterium]